MIDRWYGVRVRPGAQRIAVQEDGQPQPRPFEYVIERQCRSKGYECFTPSFWTRVQHSRSKRMLTKRYPHLTSYCFVNLTTLQFEKLRTDVQGVGYILGGASGPIQFPSSIIDMLRIDDWKERITFERNVHQRDEEIRLKEISRLRGTLRSILPKGRAVRVKIKEEREVALDRLPPRSRERVLTIIAQLKALEEPGLEEFAEAV